MLSASASITVETVRCSARAEADSKGSATSKVHVTGSTASGPRRCRKRWESNGTILITGCANDAYNRGVMMEDSCKFLATDAGFGSEFTRSLSSFRRVQDHFH